MTAPLVLVPLGPGEYIALEPDQLAQARERARGLLGAGDRAAAPPTQSSELLTAEEMEERTKVKAAWYLEAARRGLIPHVRLGKYVRFRLGEVIEHGAVTPPAEAGGEWGRKAKRAGGAS